MNWWRAFVRVSTPPLDDRDGADRSADRIQDSDSDQGADAIFARPRSLKLRGLL